MEAKYQVERHLESRPFFTREHLLFRDSLRKLLQKEAVPYFEQWEKKKMVPRSFWRLLGQKGFLCSWIDEKYGGLGVDFGFSVILTEELERVGSGLMGIPLHCDIVAPYIASFGTEQQKETYLPLFMTGEIISAIAMTEPVTGSDLAGMQTTAVREGNHYVVNGAKTFITNGIQADIILVACKTDLKADPPYDGISLLLIDKDTPGFKRGRQLEKMGHYSSDTTELFFDQAIVPAKNLLGEEGQGFRYLMQNLQQERIIAALNAQVAAEEMFSLTMDYIKKRKAFGKAVSDFQNSQFVMAEMATEITLGRTFLDELIGKHMEGKEIVTEVSMAKWWITEMAKKNAGKCMQLHGGYGYMEDYKIARRYRDIAVTTIFAGTSEIMKKIISKGLGM